MGSLCDQDVINYYEAAIGLGQGQTEDRPRRVIIIVSTQNVCNIFNTEDLMLFDANNLLQTVADNVRKHRYARNWSQQELTDRSQVSRGMIVRIESGEGNVSLATLGRIALAFGVPFTDIVADPAQDEGATSGIAEHRIQVWQGTRPGTKVTLLESFVGQRMTDFFEWTVAPGDRYQGEPDMKGTKEMVYVVKGTLTLEHENGTRILKAGESIVFPSDRQYVLINNGKSALCFVLSVVG